MCQVHCLVRCLIRVSSYLMHWPSSTDPDDLKKHYPDWNFIDTW